MGQEGSKPTNDERQAEKLRQALKEHRWSSSLTRTIQRAPRWLAAGSLASSCRPQGPGRCDHNSLEQTANLLTSLPFVWLACRQLREAKTAEANLFGLSTLGVAAGSLAFHASGPQHRCAARKADYWAIALSASALVRATMPRTSGLASAMSVATIPFQPLLVTSCNTVAVEAEFWKRARRGQDRRLRDAHKLHLGGAGLASVCFAIEDLVPQVPLVHATWHCLSAFSLAGMQRLVADADRRHLAVGTQGMPKA